MNLQAIWMIFFFAKCFYTVNGGSKYFFLLERTQNYYLEVDLNIFVFFYIHISVFKSSVSLHIILQASVIVDQNDRVKGFELIFFVHSNAVILFCIIYPKKGNLSVLYEKLPRTAFHYVV